MLKRIAKRILGKTCSPPITPKESVSDSLYRPTYTPWNSKDFDDYFSIAAPRTLVSRDRCYVLERLLKQTLSLPGDIIECGVYKGGTAAMIAQILSDESSRNKFYLFDTFEGMPETDLEKDLHQKGDFADTSLEEVRNFVGHEEKCDFRPGFIPDTFRGLEDIVVSFCHIDLDIYKSIMDSLDFLWPCMHKGGIIVFDDYGFPTCPGALEAVDEFFLDKESIPLCLHTGQAIVIKN